MAATPAARALIKTRSCTASQCSGRVVGDRPQRRAQISVSKDDRVEPVARLDDFGEIQDSQGVSIRACMPIGVALRMRPTSNKSCAV